MLGAMSPFENMSTLNVVVGIVFIVLTLLLLIPGALASTGKLPGNKWFGLHVPACLLYTSDAAAAVEQAREKQAEEPKPAVNIDALRRAAGRADEQK